MTEHSRRALARVEITAALTKLEGLFTRDMRLCFVAVDPTHLDKTLFVGAADPDQVIAALNHICPPSRQTQSDAGHDTDTRSDTATPDHGRSRT